MNFYVYIVECSDGTYYCGYAKDLNSRIEEHNGSKTGARYTKSRRPVKLVYSEEFQSKSQAMKREAEIKKLSRRRKEALVLGQRSD
ncbi:MAG: GIY-YIG nuclease family protein [Patescibacteria group bacterium]